MTEYLSLLQKRQRWLQPQRNIGVGDLVLIADSGAPRNSWPMGIVEKVKVGSKGLVRSATVMTKTTVLDRPISKICVPYLKWNLRLCLCWPINLKYRLGKQLHHKFCLVIGNYS